MSEVQHPGQRIVAGVDGSESSQEALRWAARQADLTGGALKAVMAWDRPKIDLARQELAVTVEKAVGAEQAARISTVVEYGTPAGVLLQAAEEASLLVVGSRGQGGFNRMLLGSVGHQCTLYAHCPVVVVRGSKH